MKDALKNRIKELAGTDAVFDILTPPNPELGDYSVNLPFMLAKKEGRNPQEIGREIASKLAQNDELRKYFSKIEFAPPGFINFFLSDVFLRSEVLKVIDKKESYGSGEDKKIKINLEFVSANPTGPSTVHNARAAAYGDTLGNIFKKVGYGITKEYYINDVGVQVGKLAESIRLRMKELQGEKIEFGDDLYQGEYIKEIAKEFLDRSVPEEDIREEAVRAMVTKLKKALSSLGVEFDEWFSESKLHGSGEVKAALRELESKGYVFEEEGAQWLKISEEQKAVLVKKDGATTYLMNDIAYTKNKFERGFDKAINIWGADHHGDVPRLIAGVKALGYGNERLEILLHQLVSVKSGGEKQRMSKRRGEFVLLEELLGEVGKDAVRYFFLVKDLNTHMEFDIDLAKEQSSKNPVYYIQYANARLNQIFEKFRITNYELPWAGGLIPEVDLSLLKEPEELMLMRKMSKFPELIGEIAQTYQVHHLAQYSYELASEFHNFYEKNRVLLEDDKKLEKARLVLCRAVANVLGNCLGLMGINAPERM